MEDEWKLIGSFPFSCGQNLLKKLEGVTDKDQKKEIVDSFIADNRYAFLTPEQRKMLEDAFTNQKVDF